MLLFFWRILRLYTPPYQRPHRHGPNDLWANQYCSDERRNNAFLGSTEVFPSTKESLLICPMSGPTGKTALVAQRRRLGTRAAYHTCDENWFLKKVATFASNNFCFHCNLKTCLTRVAGFKAITVPELHLQTNNTSIFSCQQAVVKDNESHNALHDSTCIQVKP